MGRVVGWNRRAQANYTRYRTGKGNLLRWKKTLDPGPEDTSCRRCGRAEETRTHVALTCSENEELGRRFGSWEQVGDPERVFRKVKKGDQVV